jgi:hypothetical protein
MLDNKDPIYCLEYINWTKDHNTIAVGGAVNVRIWESIIELRLG